MVWAGFLLVLAVAPLVFSSSFSITLLSQVGYLAIICLSYNLLLGRGGMLSFGHAVYSGAGAFMAVHAMKMAGQGSLALPVPFVPLVGGLAGLVLAALLGYVSTRKSGTTFAMITLGMGELAFAAALMFPGVFGGEAGVSANRTLSPSFAGLSFGSALQVYYLIAAYCLACTAALYAFNRTPLGMLLEAVRDNAQRVEFIGYDPRRVRYYAFIVAGFFAGIGGGLAAVSTEIVTSEALGSMRSASILLFVFLGGTAFFAGPLLGAVLMVLALAGASTLTRGWQLYVGAMFIVMVMYAPGGIGGLLLQHAALLRQRGRRLAPAYVALLISSATVLLGMALLIEMAYHSQLDAALGSELVFLSVRLDTARPAAWFASAGLLLLGAGLLRTALKHWRRISALALRP